MAQSQVEEARTTYENGWQEREKAVQQAVRAAVLEHKRAGNPIAVWRDGKVVILQPEEIDVTEADL